MYTYILVCVPCMCAFSFIHLQEEKERQFHESRAAFEEMVRSKDHEIHTLQNKLTALTKDMAAKNEVSTLRVHV